MIGLVLIYFVGKAFYELAHDHDRSRWGFAILGVISYYGGQFVGQIILAVIFAFYGSLDGISDILLSIMALPFGVLICWGFYQILKRSWSRSSENSNPTSAEVLDADLFKDKPE